VRFFVRRLLFIARNLLWKVPFCDDKREVEASRPGLKSYVSYNATDTPNAGSLRRKRLPAANEIPDLKADTDISPRLKEIIMF
jgi:hypothetical protein